jgi:hypothetical protein
MAERVKFPVAFAVTGLQWNILVIVAAILLLNLAGCRHHHAIQPAAATVPARKGVNVVLVVDRSGSLLITNSCEALKEAAVSFVNRFTPGRDNVGLVTFATSTYVNFPIASTFQAANPNIATILTNIHCAGSTSTAQGLWTGYQQLLGLNQPDAVNVILFFTDGMPTGVTFDMPVAGSSPCTQYTPGAPNGAGAYTMPSAGKGYIRGVYNSFTNVSQWFGLLNHIGVAGSDGLQSITNNDLQAATNSEGCTYYTNWPRNIVNTSDFLGAPTKDIYGNSANTAYQPVTLNKYGFIDIGNNKNAQAMALNAADSAAANIRNGAADPVSSRGLSNVIIYSIGLRNVAYPASPEFLERASNDPRSLTHDWTKPAGMYIDATDSERLQWAFSAVSLEILRVAK